MPTEPLPSELDQLERELSAAFRADPSPSLGHRIATTVQNELRRKRTVDRWNFAAALAATFLIWANLSLCAVSVTDFRFRPEPKTLPVEELAQEIHKLLPELTREDAHREAVMMSR
jgi:hypothetical protein